MKYEGISNHPWERSSVTYDFVTWNNSFSAEELDRIEKYCDSEQLERAKILGTEEDSEVEKIRRCNLKFHSRNDENAWIFDNFNRQIFQINARWYGFDLNGYEHFQYTTYDAAELGKYGWHMDLCMGLKNLPAGMTEPRKLSLSMQLNDSSEFDGGEFQINCGDQDKSTTVKLERGDIVAFPSFIPHQVTPVTRGVRKSIVIWVVGPKFR